MTLMLPGDKEREDLKGLLKRIGLIVLIALVLLTGFISGKTAGVKKQFQQIDHDVVQVMIDGNQKEYVFRSNNCFTIFSSPGHECAFSVQDKFFICLPEL